MGRHNKYTKDYETRIEEVEGKEKKKVVYTGVYYRLNVEGQKKKKVGMIYLIFQAVFIALFLWMGLNDTDGTRKVYVVLPYIFLFLPIYYGIMGTIKLLTSKKKMEFAEYDKSVARIKRSASGVLVLAGCVAVGEGVYLLSNQIMNFKSPDYRFLMGTLLLMAISYLFLQIQSRYQAVPITE